LVLALSNLDPSINILPATWRDFQGVLALEKACFGNDAWSVVDIFFALIGPVVRLKAVTGDRVIGFVMGDPRRREGFAWIATIGVHPDYQRRGIGARLLTAAEAQLAVSLLKLTVRTSNAPAIALYEKYGYRPVHVWERYYSGDEAGIVMEKRR
jgi:ribosomal-protein-alanine N-acetyltransferase